MSLTAAVLATLPWLNGFFAPNEPATNSDNAAVVFAEGDGAIGVPLVAVAVTSGDRDQTWTRLRLYRVAADGALVQVFAGDVEHHTRDRRTRTTRTGIVTLLPGSLVHRDPAGTLSLWTYDAQGGQSTEAFSTRPPT